MTLVSVCTGLNLQEFYVQCTYYVLYTYMYMYMRSLYCTLLHLYLYCTLRTLSVCAVAGDQVEISVHTMSVHSSQ